MESILDYLEFLIKFKFKTSKENKFILNIRNTKLKEIDKKLEYKKYIFNKIISWFTLFDEYTSYVKNNTLLDDDNNLIEDFSNVSYDINDLNSGSKSVFLFKINLQRAEFLKGKFALRCKNYTDALFYFIRASKKNSIALDGLIIKKSLKNISKILNKLIKKYGNYGILNWAMKEKIKEYGRNKMHQYNKKLSQIVKNNNFNKRESIKYQNTFKKEMMIIKENLEEEIGEYNINQTKDIIIIIDFNMYNQELNNINNTDKIDSFIDQTITILDNYLSNNDRLGAFFYKDQLKIICPLSSKDKIDLEYFSKDLLNYKKIILEEYKEDEDSSFDELNEDALDYLNIEIEIEKQNLSKSNSVESVNDKEKQINIGKLIRGLIDTINYSENYLELKKEIKNEKYIILFSDIFNTYNANDEIIKTNFSILNKNKEITFLLVGKKKTKDIKNVKNKEIYLNEEKDIIQIIINKFGERSELIYFENMKKIKNIISNKVIIDKIKYPNEIYN